MGTEDLKTLMLFYADMGKLEWESIISSKPPSEISPEDFAHAEFCSAVRRYVIKQSFIHYLASNHPGLRYWGGFKLYEYWSIEKLFPCNRN